MFIFYAPPTSASLFWFYYSIRLDSLCFVTDDIESCMVKVKLNNRTIVIVGIYRPPNGDVECFTNILLLILNEPN